MKKKLSLVVAGTALSAAAVGVPTAVASTQAPAAASASAVRHADSAHGSAKPREAKIAALFDRWNAAVETGDPEKVADLYAPDAVLLPTLSPQIRTTRAEIVDYFEHFLAKHPSGTILRSIVEVLGNRSAVDSGIYRFTFHNADGTTESVDARYTFVYEKRGGEWLIVSHHSSLLPAAS